VICVPTVINKVRVLRCLPEQNPSNYVLASLNRMLSAYAASDLCTGHFDVVFSVLPDEW
jgi:hypothetical protein